MSVFYATAVFLGEPLHTLWPSLVLLMAALVPGAVYVSTINDVTDRKEDVAAGKAIRDVAPLALAGIVSASVLAGVFAGWRWRDDPALLGCYAAAWVAFFLYSVPPFRFKTRGALGVVCDAAGSMMFPSLVAALLAYRSTGTARRDALWLAGVGVWALACGLRGILWHQLVDTEADQRAGAHTFVQSYGVERTIRFGTWVVFPVELLALTVLLAHLPPLWPGVALVCYIAFAWARIRQWRMAPVLVAPLPHSFIVLFEFYVVFLPLALLAMAAVANTADLIVLAGHCLVFPVRILEAVRTGSRLVQFRSRLGWIKRSLSRKF